MFPFIPALALGTLAVALFSDKRRVAPTSPIDEGYGAMPPPPASMASGASVLQSAGLAAPGWTGRNVLAAGAKSANARRLAGNATEADFAVLSAARPGIASGVSGPISGAWTGNPWQPGPGVGPGPRSLWSRLAAGAEDDIDDIGDEVADEFGAEPSLQQTAWNMLPPPIKASIQAFITSVNAGIPGIRAYDISGGEDINGQRYGVVTLTAHDPYGLLNPVSRLLTNAAAPYGVTGTMTPLTETPGQMKFVFSAGATPLEIENDPDLDVPVFTEEDIFEDLGESEVEYGAWG